MNALAIRSMTDDQVALVKRTICKDGTDDDLKLFIGVCNATGLNPFLKQIYAVFRREKGRDGKTMTIQTGIDGLRLTADRSGKYSGQLSPQWCGADAKWLDVWLDEKNPPAAARVGVLRSDFKEPCYGVATFASFAVWEPVYMNGSPTGEQKLGRFWMRMAPEQLAKCAEALALRKAFPAETAGLRTDDEMAQADEVVIHATVERPAASVAPEPPRSLPDSPTPTLAAELAEKRRKAKEAKAAEKAKTPTPAAPAAKAPGEAIAPPISPTPSPGASPSAPVSDAVKRHADLVARLGGEKWEDLAAVLLEGNPEDRDRSVSESTRKATLARGIAEADYVREAKRIGVIEGEPTIAQCLALALLLPLPETAGVAK